MCAMSWDKSDVERMLSLLEDQVELAREQNQLLGELLGALDNLKDRPTGPNVLTEAAVKPPVPEPDMERLTQAMFADGKSPDIRPDPAGFDVFWPKAKALPGWVRVSVKHPDSASLSARLQAGCLCGKAIILKEMPDGSSFYTCEALTQRGSCAYRPGAYFDKLTFVCNLPPKK